MCGRFTLTVSGDNLKEALDLGSVPEEVGGRYNIAPTQPVAVVMNGEARDVELLRWGLIPSWAKDTAIGSRLINARAETVAEKPAFRAAFAKRRCLVLADGFYEWQREGKRRQPYYFRLREGNPFTFAGLWEQWRDPASGEWLRTCTIITSDANEVVAPVHDRSPVILAPDVRARWLDEDATTAELTRFLRPYPAEAMEGYAVAPLVNSPAHDTPELINSL